ncbi:hypothetical protein PSPO01_14615 [Paraphaeosphaeria sporulosa]
MHVEGSRLCPRPIPRTRCASLRATSSACATVVARRTRTRNGCWETRCSGLGIRWNGLRYSSRTPMHQRAPIQTLNNSSYTTIPQENRYAERWLLDSQTQHAGVCPAYKNGPPKVCCRGRSDPHPREDALPNPARFARTRMLPGASPCLVEPEFCGVTSRDLLGPLLLVLRPRHTGRLLPRTSPIASHPPLTGPIATPGDRCSQPNSGFPMPPVRRKPASTRVGDLLSDVGGG